MARALALGFLVGLPIAAVPGPIFFLTLRRTLTRGWANGLASGLGVATGDAIYAALAAFGVAAVTSFLIAERRWISLAGGIAIGLIGLQTLVRRQRPYPDAPPEGDGTLEAPAKGEGIRRARLVGAYLSMVALTLANPPTILSFIAVFAALGRRVGAGWLPALALVAGVMLGSAVWWVLLTAIVAALRERLTPTITRGIGFAAGIALIAFGILISLQSA